MNIIQHVVKSRGLKPCWTPQTGWIDPEKENNMEEVKGPCNYVKVTLFEKFGQPNGTRMILGFRNRRDADIHMTRHFPGQYYKAEDKELKEGETASLVWVKE